LVFVSNLWFDTKTKHGASAPKLNSRIGGYCFPRLRALFLPRGGVVESGRHYVTAPLNIVLIGALGAGKGTQAAKLASRFGLVHVASGDLFRQNLEKGTALGRRAKRYMDQGELVPEEITQAMMRERLLQVEPHQGIVLDGFPRTEYQATVLDEILKEVGRTLAAAIFLFVPDEVIVESRLPGRLTCKQCQRPYHSIHNPPERPMACDACGGDLYRRSDDTPEGARARLRVFHRQFPPVVFHYLQSGRLRSVDGEGGIEEVHALLCETIEALAKHPPRPATSEEAGLFQALKSAPRALSSGEVAHRSPDLVLLGGPGSGKGTQAEHLRSHLHLTHIATGDLFREHLKLQTDLGKLAKAFMDRGELVPDDVTEEMVRERLSRPDTAGGFVLDGFPRTLPQAEALTEMMTDLGRRVTGVLYMKVSDQEIVKRLSGRRICRSCQTPYHTLFKPPVREGGCDACGGQLYQRDDDNPETVLARLKTFHGQTAPLIDYYERVGLLVEIDGEQSVAEVTERILAAAQGLLPVTATTRN
jgi:adenylate kinase